MNGRRQPGLFKRRPSLKSLRFLTSAATASASLPSSAIRATTASARSGVFEVVDDDALACRGKRDRDRLADAGGGTSDDPHLAGEPAAHSNQ
jgi:hypothetical protein